MKPLDYPLLADENIHPEVVSALKANGKDVRSVHLERPDINAPAPFVAVVERRADTVRVRLRLSR